MAVLLRVLSVVCVVVNACGYYVGCDVDAVADFVVDGCVNAVADYDCVAIGAMC